MDACDHKIIFQGIQESAIGKPGQINNIVKHYFVKLNLYSINSTHMLIKSIKFKNSDIIVYN